MIQNKDFAKQVTQAIEVVQRIGHEILRQPGVVTVGVGPERRKGELTGRAAIVVTVREKLRPKQLKERGTAQLPQEIEGVPVDVVEFRKPVESQAIRKAIKKATSVKDRVASTWLQTKNVTAIGVGYKKLGGKVTNDIVIRIYVERKLPPDEVEKQGFRLVPPEIGGVATDVIQMGPFKEMVSPSGHRGDRQDPLVGGLSIGHASAPFYYGTLAAIAFDKANNAVILSNEHVLDGDIGETVHQPAPVSVSDSFEVSFQLDVCNPLNFVRMDTPDTLGGSILAGSAAGVALAAALSDEIDPTREGQQATLPPAGAQTLEDYTKVKINYPIFPLPGTPFELDVSWDYERRMDSGTLHHKAERKAKNPHVIHYHRLFTDKSLYNPSQTVRLYGVLIVDEDLHSGDTTPPPPLGEGMVYMKPIFGHRRCDHFHCVAILRPQNMDRSYPVVLRLANDSLEIYRKILHEFLELLASMDIDPEEKKLINNYAQRLCLYYGEFSAADVPLGAWKHWMHVQTVNHVSPGIDPLKPATIIGGLPVSNHYKETMDIACGPFVFQDDGNFDIELISI